MGNHLSFYEYFYSLGGVGFGIGDKAAIYKCVFAWKDYIDKTNDREWEKARKIHKERNECRNGKRKIMEKDRKMTMKKERKKR